MLTRRLRERAPSATPEGTGFAKAYRITFDKVSTDGSGKCCIEPTNNPTEVVYGVLFSIKVSEARDLDRVEGVGSGYRKDIVTVTTPSGPCAAVAYIGEKRNSKLLPYEWYKEFVVQGAIEHGLPSAYVESLKAVESKADNDPTRRRENEAILRGK